MTASSPPPRRRCAWGDGDELLRRYHDEEWGVPERDSRRLWEHLALDGFQAGLSWVLILRKREALRRAFRNFDPERVSRFGDDDVRRLLGDPAIVRSPAKIRATIAGARAFLAMQASGEEFSTFVWNFVGGVPIQTTGPVPAQTELSRTISRALKDRGFKFVGPVIVYAWMQAVGLVNDHAPECFRRPIVSQLGRVAHTGRIQRPSAVRAPTGLTVRARRSPPARGGRTARPRRAAPS